jgi:hypothetical protein
VSHSGYCTALSARLSRVRVPSPSPILERRSMTNPVIENNFTHHAPSENQVDRYKLLREKAKELAYAINERCPDSREKSLAMTNLEQAVFWANASIARQHGNSSRSGT